MKIDWKWNAPVRGVFRIAAGFLGILALGVGVMLLYFHEWRGIALLGWSVFFLIVAIRGRWFKSDSDEDSLPNEKR
jgi:hypothetical protein